MFPPYLAVCYMRHTYLCTAMQITGYHKASVYYHRFLTSLGALHL